MPGGVVNAAGGNLLVERTDLTVDSLVGGSLPVGAVYNSSLGGWTWNFAMRWDGVTLTDASGRSFDTSALAAGAAIPGTHWVKLDSDTVQTKGGLAHDFDGLGRLVSVHWATLEHPRIRYTWSASALEIAQCPTAASCTLFSRSPSTRAAPPSVTDTRSARRAEFTWDAARPSQVARSPLEVAKGWPGTQYEYAPLGRSRAITNSEGERIEYAYQSGGRIFAVTQIGEGDPTHRFDFHSADRPHLQDALHQSAGGAHAALLRPGVRGCGWSASRRASGELHLGGAAPGHVTLANGATTAFGYAGDEPVRSWMRREHDLDHVPARRADHESPNSRAVARIQDTLGLVEERSSTPRAVWSVANGEGESVDLPTTAHRWSTRSSSRTAPRSRSPLRPHGHWLEMDGVVSDKRGFEPTGTRGRVGQGKARRRAEPALRPEPEAFRA